MDELVTLGLPQIETAEVRVERLLKFGAFGRIYNAHVNGEQMVVKLFDIRHGPADLKQSVIREAKMLHLARDFELIVKIHGWFVSSCGIDVGFILEKADQDFDEYIHGSMSLISELHRLDYIISLLVDLAEALLYLHEQSIVHRDIKPRNCLLFRDENMSVSLKLADFGSTRVLPSDTEQLTVQVGTVLWQAPEMDGFEKDGYDERVDIYSFGVILWECLTKKYPFCGNSKSNKEMKECQKDDWQVTREKRHHCHPGPIPKLCNEDITEKLSNLIFICCAMDPDKRPDAESILEVLLGIWNQYSDTVLTIQYNINEYPNENSLQNIDDQPNLLNSRTINYVHSNSLLSEENSTLDSISDSLSRINMDTVDGLSHSSEFIGTQDLIDPAIDPGLPPNDFDNTQ